LSLMFPLPPTSALFPYTTLFRSGDRARGLALAVERAAAGARGLDPGGEGEPARRGELERGRSRQGEGLLAVEHGAGAVFDGKERSEEHTSELQSLTNLVCRLLLA